MLLVLDERCSKSLNRSRVSDNPAFTRVEIGLITCYNRGQVGGQASSVSTMPDGENHA